MIHFTAVIVLEALDWLMVALLAVIGLDNWLL